MKPLCSLCFPKNEGLILSTKFQVGAVKPEAVSEEDLEEDPDGAAEPEMDEELVG